LNASVVRGIIAVDVYGVSLKRYERVAFDWPWWRRQHGPFGLWLGIPFPIPRAGAQLQARRYATRPGAVYQVPLMAPLGHHIIILAMTMLPAVCITLIAHLHNSTPIRLLAPLAETVAASPCRFHLPPNVHTPLQSLIIFFKFFHRTHPPIRSLGVTRTNPTSGKTFATVPTPKAGQLRCGAAYVT
jgi:hypothetical protein